MDREPDTANAPGDQPIEEALADRLPGAGGPAERALRELARVDEAIYAVVASTPTPTLDQPLRRLSNAANRSGLWLAIAGALAALGGGTGRRAAMHGVLAIAVTSALVNLGIKALSPRGRPNRSDAGVPATRHVRMPVSSSFPSGHSAAGFAFATAVGQDVPLLALPLRLLAAGVAYARVHTGVHYPGDTVAGSLVGAATGLMVGGVLDQRTRSARRSELEPGGRRPTGPGR